MAALVPKPPNDDPDVAALDAAAGMPPKLNAGALLEDGAPSPKAGVAGVAGAALLAPNDRPLLPNKLPTVRCHKRSAQSDFVRLKQCTTPSGTHT